MNTLTYAEKKQRVTDMLHTLRGGDIRLGKDTSNLFRDRHRTAARQLDVRDFNQVLVVDSAAGYVEAEGMTPYVKLVAECLKHGVMPAVVPQLKSITIGGATVGCGIEASSFRYGLVHESVQEMEVLLSDGRCIVCTPNNEHRDLFFGMPNSYGTLGYILKLRAKVVPVKEYVQLSHLHFTDTQSWFADLTRQCNRDDIDFVDGVIFGPSEMVITIGQFTDHAPYISNYTYENIYYQSLQTRTQDYLTTADYIWRWDTDWFWCSKNLWAQNAIIRRLYGRTRLNSITYTKIMRWNSRWNIMHYFNKLRGVHAESVIQDVEIPIENGPKFLAFYHANIRFMPVWICPTRRYNQAVKFNLYTMDPQKLYINFGFWDVISGRKKLPQGFYNRQIEEKVVALGGIKSLYSDSYFTPAQFWRIYNKADYDALKIKYDPDNKLKNLYEKCVLKA